MKKVFFASILVALSISLVGCNDSSGGGAPSYEGPGVSIHYQRSDKDYTDWNLWLWEVNGDGGAFEFNGSDDYGKYASYPLSTWTDPVTNGLGFIVRKGEWKAKDVDADRFIDFKKLTQDDKEIYHIYLKSGDANIYINPEGGMVADFTRVEFTSMNEIFFKSTVKFKSYKVLEGETEIAGGDLTIEKDFMNVKLPSDKKVDFSKPYTVSVTLVTDETMSKEVSKRKLYDLNDFGELYNYEGNDLGATYTSSKTTFKVWSPTSAAIKLKIYNDGTPASLGGSDATFKEVDMIKGEKGVYSAEVDGDLEDKYYTYAVTNSKFTAREVVDPYAKSAGVNGLRGMIVDFSKTNPTNWEDVDYLDYDRKELTVYETHVADVTSSSTWGGTAANAKLFKGMYESNTTYTEGDKTVKTGFDHIKELGVNAVQLIPIYDQDNDELNMTFNWGYNPLNYNCLEGGYSSNPKDGYARIKEFKELVKAYNEADITIIMDVVYNHVSGAAGSNFDVLMPEYYYRYDALGNYANGSGCGNETASNHYMMRKFMIDSACFWASEYKLGGFRFDLMGLHDLTTMEELTKAVKTINPHITIYGEPWTGGDSPLSVSQRAAQANGNSFKGYGAFNDMMRDSLVKSGLHGTAELGWITNEESSISTGDMKAITEGIKGNTASTMPINDPDKTVNYVSCHDNYTLYDRAIATGLYDEEDDAQLAKMNVLANAVVFTSQGTSFMLAGEEFLRTKGGNGNSYNASYKVNELDYSLKIKHLDMFESYQKLIMFKKGLSVLHADKDHNDMTINVSDNKATISYKITDAVSNMEVYVLHTNGLGDASTYDLSGYTCYWSTIHGEDRALSNSVTLDKYETLIAYKDLA
ncbi:MAG: type I pullulanase [Erysipelotrichaceae bacterium]|nr:type I pullulanase [Erysipelotrichaceae bacterium]